MKSISDKQKKVILVIPARFASSRFPGKPLANICGKPMLQWVYEKACILQKRGKVSRVIIATDDRRIQKTASGFGAEVLMTSKSHQSGTDRVAETARCIRGDIYVNIQGDEPLIEPDAIEKALDLVLSRKFSIGTLMAPIESKKELFNLNCVKVVTSKDDQALYFSRFPIPYSKSRPQNGPWTSFRHIGVYVYQREALLKLSTIEPSPLEMAESLEQLRALENGFKIGVAFVPHSAPGVDTPNDLRKITRRFNSHG